MRGVMHPGGDTLRRLEAAMARNALRTADAENDAAAPPDPFRENRRCLNPLQRNKIHLAQPVDAWIRYVLCSSVCSEPRCFCLTFGALFATVSVHH